MDREHFRDYRAHWCRHKPCCSSPLAKKVAPGQRCPTGCPKLFSICPRTCADTMVQKKTDKKSITGAEKIAVLRTRTGFSPRNQCARKMPEMKTIYSTWYCKHTDIDFMNIRRDIREIMKETWWNTARTRMLVPADRNRKKNNISATRQATMMKYSP